MEGVGRNILGIIRIPKIQKNEDRTSLSFTTCQIKLYPPPMPSGPDRPVTACTARLWPPAPKIQLPLGSQGRAAECFCFVFYCEFHWVDRRWVCTLFVIKPLCDKYIFLKKVLRKRSVISASWWLKCFSFIPQKCIYIKHFHYRSLWIFPHKDFITLTHLFWAKIINSKTKSWEEATPTLRVRSIQSL